MKKILYAVGALCGWLVSTMAFAAPEGGASTGEMIAVGAGLAIGLGALGAATGQGRATGSALEGIARNPQAREQMFMWFILGLVFMEFQALLGFTIAILLWLKM